MTRKNIEEVFWSRVDIREENECWPWIKFRDKDGYGRFSFKNRSINAQRMALMFFRKEIELPKLHTLHTCDNPSCCNPKHLYLGTQADNNRDAYARKRRKDTKGENHPCVKLTERQIQTIRLIGNALSRVKMAELSHVKPGYISMIVHRRSWKHLPDWRPSPWAA